MNQIVLDPPFMYLGCADSRVSEGTIFNAKPGTLLVQRNIANQFLSLDDDVWAYHGYFPLTILF